MVYTCVSGAYGEIREGSSPFSDIFYAGRRTRTERSSVWFKRERAERIFGRVERSETRNVEENHAFPTSRIIQDKIFNK